MLTAPAVIAECLIAAALFRARSSVFDMRTRGDVWYFLLVSIGAPLASAVIVWAGKQLTPYPMSLYDMGIWIAADALALIVFLPILKGVGDSRWRDLLTGDKRIRTALWMASIIFISTVSALTPIPGFRLVLVPLLAALVFDLGVAGAQASMAVLTATWLTLALRGYSPAPWFDGRSAPACGHGAVYRRADFGRDPAARGHARAKTTADGFTR